MEFLHSSNLAQTILERAIAFKASDVHVEPTEAGVRVRIRVDGLLTELCMLPLAQYSSLVTQLKVRSGMDIAEKRVPQDGRLSFACDGSVFDLRLAALPTVAGEKIAVRILAREQALLNLDNLSFTPAALEHYRSLFSQANGLVLLTGPTGSGKTTTLYATLHELNSGEKNIITLEDPVEYRLNGINQVAVNRRAGMNFAAGLRSIVRQDPDIIMLGEIRDEETASMALHAALTGHLVLSTLHTNDAVGALYRLADMGLPAYLLAAALRGVLAQRLVRRICPHCKEAYLASTSERAFLGCAADEGLTLWRGVGCEHCHGSGYSGRIALQEVLVLNKKLQQLFLAKASEDEILSAARAFGWRSLYEDAAAKVYLRMTTVNELWRAGITCGGSDVV